MIRLARTLIGAVVLVGIVVSVSGSALAATTVGEPAPDFTLHDVDGNEVALSNYGGKTVVLEWFNSECPFVKKHYRTGHMQKLQAQAKEDGVVWLTIDSTHPGHKSFVPAEQRHALLADFKMASSSYLADETGTVGR
ncbi:MAG: redoxin domain-containing protein, partial [Bdellovibrionales bacterium]|nr:redoxin domain-containing protein [Bdellovibrionales bacterium]